VGYNESGFKRDGYVYDCLNFKKSERTHLNYMT
jgi:hypothetical protein